jgi:Protein of unknown function (DUF2934)
MSDRHHDLRAEVMSDSQLCEAIARPSPGKFSVRHGSVRKLIHFFIRKTGKTPPISSPFSAILPETQIRPESRILEKMCPYRDGSGNKTVRNNPSFLRPLDSDFFGTLNVNRNGGMFHKKTGRKGCRLALLIFCVLRLCCVNNTFAIEAQAASVRPVQTTQKTGDLVVTIEASRPQLSAGSGFGLTAELRNTSEKAVRLRPSHTTLMLPPELQGGGILWDTAYYAFFPTETAHPNGGAFNSDVYVLLQPDNSYIVKWAWDPNVQGTASRQRESSSEGRHEPLLVRITPPFVRGLLDTISSELQFIFFSPGDYKVEVVAQYHAEGDPEDQDKTVIQSALIHVNAPESVILFGAAIGGILGYLISRIYVGNDSNLKRSVRPTKLGGMFGGAVGSMLLAAIVTILLARISESQFLVRININDFWGAIAVGFIASISGIRILDRLIGSRTGEADGRSETDKAVVGSEKHTSGSPGRLLRGGARTEPRAAANDNQEAIRLHAYSIYEQRRKSGSKGNEISDWIQAERELTKNSDQLPGSEQDQQARKFSLSKLFRSNSQPQREA